MSRPGAARTLTGSDVFPKDCPYLGDVGAGGVRRLALAAAGGACAQRGDATEKVTQLNREALAAIDKREFEKARELLKRALDLCQSAGLEQHPIAARTHIHMGVVIIQRLQEPRARQQAVREGAGHRAEHHRSPSRCRRPTWKRRSPRRRRPAAAAARPPAAATTSGGRGRAKQRPRRRATPEPAATRAGAVVVGLQLPHGQRGQAGVQHRRHGHRRGDA